MLMALSCQSGTSSPGNPSGLMLFFGDKRRAMSHRVRRKRWFFQIIAERLYVEFRSH